MGAGLLLYYIYLISSVLHVTYTESQLKHENNLVILKDTEKHNQQSECNLSMDVWLITHCCS